MSLESLLGQRVTTKTNTNKEKLSPKDTVLNELDKQIRLVEGKNIPETSVKKNGKVVKDPVTGKTQMVPIKSWFNSNTNQFKPTPSGLTFFKGDQNAFDIGSVSKMDILNTFKECIENGTYNDDLEDWSKRCDTRNSNVGGKK